MRQMEEQNCSSVVVIEPKIDVGGHLHRSQHAWQSLSIILIHPYHDVHLLQLAMASSASHAADSLRNHCMMLRAAAHMHRCSRNLCDPLSAPV